MESPLQRLKQEKGKVQHNGSIISLAWPETPVRRIGVWYDVVTKWLGFIEDDYYKAGHAAAILVDHKNGQLSYFDFGRYHTPAKIGRVRDAETDPELALSTKAELDHQGSIKNLHEVLSEVSQKESTHGSGRVFASVYTQIDFASAYAYCKKLQSNDRVHYGPFDLRGTNCSRFVAAMIKQGHPAWWTKLRLMIPLTFTPTTKSNVVIANDSGNYYSINHGRITLHHTFISQILNLFNTGYGFNKNMNETSVSHSSELI